MSVMHREMQYLFITECVKENENRKSLLAPEHRNISIFFILLMAGTLSVYH